MRKTVFRTLFLAGFAALAASPAHADIKTGVDAWTTGNYPAAVREWRGPADQGNPDAQFTSMSGATYRAAAPAPVDAPIYSRLHHAIDWSSHAPLRWYRTR